ncbi:TPA: hypothetical protein QHI15_002447 [Staphylococcus aureus]|nr:hypothetical protein [Staphylococcus aureus]
MPKYKTVLLYTDTIENDFHHQILMFEDLYNAKVLYSYYEFNPFKNNYAYIIEYIKEN